MTRRNIKKLRRENMFAARPWLDNALPLSSSGSEGVNILGVVAIAIIAVVVFGFMLLYVAPIAQ